MPSEIQQAFDSYFNKTSKEINLKAVFFDMDGVLYDSMPFHEKAWKEAFLEFGYDIPPVEFHRNEGRTSASTIEELLKTYAGISPDEALLLNIREAKMKIFSQIGRPIIQKGIVSLLSEAKKNGLDIWVVTGSGQDGLLKQLQSDFAGFIDGNKMVTAHDVKIGKPNPEPYLMALEKSGLKAHEAIVVENAPLGVQSAVAAGIFTVAVNTSILENEELWRSKPDLLFKGCDGLGKHWPGILNSASVSVRK